MWVCGETPGKASSRFHIPGEDTAASAQRRRRTTLREATDLWFAGDLERCLELCDAITGAEPSTLAQVALLRARALLRLNNAAEALRVLDSLRWPEHGDIAATARMLTAAALIRSNEIPHALTILDAIDVADVHPTIRSEIALNRGLAFFCLRDVEAADRALDGVSTDADIVYARALEYRGWIACARQRYELAGTYFAAALDHLDTCKHYDRWMEANCAQVLGRLALERIDPTTWAIVTERRAKMDWSPPELQRHRFWITMVSATWAYECEGADLVAIHEARLAEQLAPTPAARVEALCRRAATVGRADERLSQLDHTEEAYELFSSLDPATFEDADKIVSLVLAKELSCAGRVEEARHVFNLYRAHSETSRHLMITGDPARDAFERLVEGFIHEAADERARARRAYLDSFTQFRALDYRRRAVHAALRLGALLNEPTLFDYADRTTRHLPPRSWLRQQVALLPTDMILRQLSRARRDVLQGLCEGLTVAEIARRRGRSPKTVANTATELYRAFRVRNRAELLSELLRRGVIRPT